MCLKLDNTLRLGNKSKHTTPEVLGILTDPKNSWLVSEPEQVDQENYEFWITWEEAFMLSRIDKRELKWSVRSKYDIEVITTPDRRLIVQYYRENGFLQKVEAHVSRDLYLTAGKLYKFTSDGEDILKHISYETE